MMTNERWEKIGQIFSRANEIELEKRVEFIRSECDGDETLFAEVMSLLESDTGPDSLLDGVAMDAVNTISSISQEGQQIGPYKLVRQIGSGGMGSVYLAERVDGQFEQQVALKLIKRGMDSEQILRRFHSERQILARLQHPNIARLLDGGITEDGRPYFAMEYIDGSAIDKYCDTRRLNVDDRLSLFRDVCKAVMYAHSNLVVHRDLKPSNILVTKQGKVKLLDFGIARFLTEDQDETQITRTGGAVMTPQYASPEQMRGESVTTSSDIYSLGVILYELLSGQRPYPLAGETPFKAAELIATKEPSRPSEIITKGTDDRPSKTISEARGTPVDRLRRRLSGDLDVICLSALRNEQERRYQSVEAFDSDIGRHLSGLPVNARNDSAAYRVSKFVERHKVGVAMTIASVMVASLLVGFYTNRLASERDRAVAEQAKTQEVVEFVTGLFEASDPSEARGRELSARELLDIGAEKIETDLEQRPEIRSTLQNVLGEVYYEIGDSEKAEALLSQSLEEQTRLYGPTHESVATSQLLVGLIKQDDGDFDVADSLYSLAHDTRMALLGPVHEDIAEIKSIIAFLEETRSDYDKAEARFREVLDMNRQLFDGDNARVAESMTQLAGVLRRVDKDEEAENLLWEALAMQERVYGEDDLEIASTKRHLASILRRSSRHARAESLLVQVIAIREKILGPEHVEVANAYNDYSLLLQSMDQLDEAAEASRKFVTILAKTYTGAHPSVAAAQNNRGMLLRDMDDFDGAIEAFNESLKIQREVFEEGHPNFAYPMIGLASTYRYKGECESGLNHSREALRIRLNKMDATHRHVADARIEIGACLRDLGRFADAEDMLLEAHKNLLEKRGEDDSRTRRAARYLVSIYEKMEKPEEAARYRPEQSD